MGDIERRSEGMNKPTVSVVIPTYNSERTLRDCLESIKHQDYQCEVEIIIADSGSTGNTLEIARKYTQTIYIRIP